MSTEPSPPSPAPYQPAVVNKDDEHLKLLSVFHYVLGGMIALVSLFPIFHLLIGIFFVMAPEEAFQGEGAPPPPMVGWMFIAISSAFMLIGFTLAAFVIAAGKSIARRNRYTFCLIMAGIECMFMPFGTALGVFTLIVLMRETVKAQFPGNQHPGDTIQQV